MSEDAQPITATGSGKSEAEIAFELVNKLKGQGVWGERNMTAILDMYAECLDATRGLRKYAGQNRYDAPTTAPAAEARLTVAQAQNSDEARLAQLQQAQRQASLQQAAQAQQPTAQQSVHAQQQMLQQQLKQG